MKPPQILFGAAVFLLLIACKSEVVTDYLNLPATPFDYSVSLPAYSLPTPEAGYRHP
jgi:hypothetical protein